MMNTGDYAIILMGARLEAERENDEQKLAFIGKEISRLIQCIPYRRIVPANFIGVQDV